jgi:hypothetical protein
LPEIEQNNGDKIVQSGTGLFENGQMMQCVNVAQVSRSITLSLISPLAVCVLYVLGFAVYYFMIFMHNEPSDRLRHKKFDSE